MQKEKRLSGGEASAARTARRAHEGYGLFSHCLVMVLCLLSFAVRSKTILVGPEGDVRSIREAVALAGPGDEILVRPGIYYEAPLVIDKPVRLTGMDFPVIDGQGEKETVIIEADGVSIEGFQIQHVGSSYLEDRAGIRVKRQKGFTIRNNRLLDTFFGVYLEYSRDGVVEGNLIAGKAEHEMSSGNAIHAWYCKNVLIRGNEVRGHRDGIYFEFVDSSRVEENLSSDNIRYGLHFMFSNVDTYTSNSFRNNGAGVAVMFSKQIDMRENLFVRNWGPASYGLLLKEIYDAHIEGNHFVENTIAILIEGSTRVVYRRNAFRSNGWAVKMSGGCLDNEFTQNNFQANTLDLVVDSKVNNNTFDGNFWSDYTGYDLDRDGTGDVPYRPVKLFSFILGRAPEAIVLLRSLFVDLVNFAEKVSPVFTPARVLDERPLMKQVEVGNGPASET